MRLNLFQQSIARTRKAINEANRLAAKMMRDSRRKRSQAETNLELFLDELAAEGVEISEENLPTIVIFVQRFVADQQRRKEELASDGGEDGMKDFPL